MSKSVVLLSGGLDSLVIMAIAHDRGDQLYPIFFQYGQKTETKELESFHKICDFYKIEKDFRKVIDLKSLGQLGGSSLTDKKISVTSELDGVGIPNSYVPFRNSIFLACAVSYAEVLKANNILIGAVLEDASGYPDCRPEYYTVFNELIAKGAKPNNNIQIQTPIINFTKEQIVENAISLNAPMEISWSCYQSSETPCWVCDSCKLREAGFEKLGKKDPLRT